MQQCEMCGSEAPITLVEIDHVELYACPKCAKFGKPVFQRTKKKPMRFTPTIKKPKKPPQKRIRQPKKDFLHDKILVDGYGTLISEARRERGLGRAEFAQIIKEKETLLREIHHRVNNRSGDSSLRGNMKYDLYSTHHILQYRERAKIVGK